MPMQQREGYILPLLLLLLLGGKKAGQSAERPVQLMPHAGAQNYLRLNEPIHRLIETLVAD